MEKKPRKQCKKCPWRVDVDPHDIPNYSEDLARGLTCTIAAPGEVRRLDAMHLMACHETEPGKELPCVGWLVNQLGPGNNIALRLAAMAGRIDANVETVGEQHETFDDTLPSDDQ